ncbi:MAG: hypothetical protein EAZ91_10010 [Cytophagales bacterium]|nr:MAG: hypothetical protein EAZ91_10010 [Cytophagales bacterium]
MNDNIIYMGVNAPRVHQAIIGQLVTGLTNLYRDRKTTLMAYPEAMIDQSRTSPVPDILLADPETELTAVLIEITHTQGVKKDTIKLKELMTEYDVPEGFVYDYKLDLWHRYELHNLDVDQSSAYCKTIGCSLSDFLF